MPATERVEHGQEQDKPNDNADTDRDAAIEQDVSD
jgi:hypothetical protein